MHPEPLAGNGHSEMSRRGGSKQGAGVSPCLCFWMNCTQLQRTTGGGNFGGILESLNPETIAQQGFRQIVQ